ncbi:MAG: lipocalin family protein [Patescibacteria group bacterium]
MKKSAIHLPHDEGAHDDPIEWWYWTAQGTDSKGKSYAIMFALFKFGLLGLAEVYFAHWFVTDVEKKKFIPHFKVFWKGLEENGLRHHKLQAKEDKDFLMTKERHGSFRLKTKQFDLRFTQTKPIMLVGGTGFVDLKTATTHYYTIPRLEVKGKILIKEKNLSFNGLGWTDQQWSPLNIKPEHAWTWFSFQLSDGTDLQCFDYGRTKRVRMATISMPNGRQKVYKDVRLTPFGDAWHSKKSGAKYPLEWKIEIPKAKIKLTCGPKLQNQEMIHGPFRYWEGPLWAHGEIGQTAVEGHGFLELNGVTSDKNIFQMLRSLMSRKKR